MILIGIAAFVLFEVGVWWVAYRAQRPSAETDPTWHRIDRNMRLATANIMLAGANVTIVLIFAIASFVLRLVR